MQLVLSEAFKNKISTMYGEEGQRWLRDLPRIINECSSLWALRIDPLPYRGSYNYVANAIRNDGTEVVVKIGYTKEKELHTEMDALKLFDGKHTVRLLASDRSLGAMMLEKLTPGSTLTEIQSVNDAKATQIAANLIRDIPIATTGTSFPHLKDWAESLSETKRESSIPASMIQKAKNTFSALDASREEEKLLHGDLHHENILLDEKGGWCAIDPKGVIGDPIFEAARFLSNPRTIELSSHAMMQRLKILAETLGSETTRIAGWGYVDCLLSACWTLEENGDPTKDLNRAKQLESFTP